MLKIIRALDVCRYSPRVYVVAATDTVSLRRLQDMEKEFKERAKGPDEEDQYVVEIVPRSREVGQSWLSSVFTTAWAFVFSMLIVFRHRPSLLLTNGPGTCVPICIAAFIMRVLCLSQIRIVFIESLCRVLSLSSQARFFIGLLMISLYSGHSLKQSIQGLYTWVVWCKLRILSEYVIYI
ncbi:hypothetical protein C7M84_019025 [Penaeus vannamei]|uniref:UDP-N-acetylglucosamine transferase subunit ALG14 n=1 Tax=Penaeus vannamei TaxID=6689 RepID=A0A3R7QC86_PENVA|nr:hypothetical protein C7M84_019025 [Penaeus vannamei]